MSSPHIYEQCLFSLVFFFNSGIDKDISFTWAMWTADHASYIHWQVHFTKTWDCGGRGGCKFKEKLLIWGCDVTCTCFELISGWKFDDVMGQCLENHKYMQISP